MNQYYSSLLKDIVEHVSKQEYEKALALIEPELNLPYVPQEAKEVLEQYQQECAPYVQYGRKNAARADLEELVKGTSTQKVMAASLLQGMNLRQYEPEVQTLLLAADLLQEFKGELIEALMDQHVDADFVLKNGKENIAFNPAKILGKKQDPVYMQTKKLLEDWLIADHPILADFCVQMLDQEVLERRPRDLSGLDPKALTSAITKLVFDAMQIQDSYEQLVLDHNLIDCESIPLRIQERGE